MSEPGVEICLTPHGRLVLAPGTGSDFPERLTAAFSADDGHALLELGSREVGTPLPPVVAYWRDFGARYITALCTGAPPPADRFAQLAQAAPPMPGGEYLSAEVLADLWARVDAACQSERAQSRQSLLEFLQQRHPAWNLVGRVHFNLAENRSDEAAPFAFIATYTPRLSAQARAQHLPLAEALREYAGARNQSRLLSLLTPVQQGAAHCPWLAAMVESGEIYHPLRWSAAEALQFLTDVPLLEAAGIVVRTPSHWKAGRPLRPQVKATVGARLPAQLGKDTLLDFQVELTLGGEPLTPAEIRKLLKGSDGLQFLRGQWVEVDKAKLSHLLDKFRQIESATAVDGLPFAAAMRLVAGVGVDADSAVDEPAARWSMVSAGPWLAETLAGLRSPAGLAHIEPGSGLRATLRPYQEAGVRWLYLLHKLGLGACLADDMGLGKTLQVLALLLVLQRESRAGGPARSVGPPALLVAPASLLANWAAEVLRFTPGLTTLLAHPSARSVADLKSLSADALAGVDLVITSYGALLRYPWLTSTQWRVVVIDEAQAIKSPGAQQTRAVKQLQARTRIALTGTPVENSLTDLWSIFDFTHPGLLGSAREFTHHSRQLAAANSYAPLRELVQPYILRRLKTDKRVISDLPAKTEMQAYCHLSPRQVALYSQAVQALREALGDADGMARKGVVLAYLMRFKQICNHPSQWLGDAAWAESDSGKFARLRDLAEVVAAKQEKMLVFTQFRETTEPLAAFLGQIFGRAGLVLHGATPVKTRQQRVQQYQQDERIPFFVLSLKAGGAGLNLTAASHVVHFDRWWNPAVENQATDRAFRIGQSRNVLVHKFVCRGTVEEKIDQMIESKRLLAADLLEGSAELKLTELSNAELLKLVTLDIHSARADG